MPCYHAALAAIALLERLNDHMLRALQREYITDTLGGTSLVFSAQSRQDAEGEPRRAPSHSASSYATGVAAAPSAQLRK